MQAGLVNFAEVLPHPTRVIVGAGNTAQEGWLSAQQADLDIRDSRSWQAVFRPNSLETILSEHVLEHLDLREAQSAARNIWTYLRCGGRWRIAVPDGFHPDANYLNWVAPDSPGERFLKMFRQPGEPDHKWLWNYQELIQFLMANGFKVVLLEYFDQGGRFHRNEWKQDDGNISRCAGSLWSGFLGVVVNAPYTSLIVDAIKVCR